MEQSTTSWSTKEFGSIDLGDKRSNRRATLQVERVAENPAASIPHACGGWRETAEGYPISGSRQTGMGRHSGGALRVFE